MRKRFTLAICKVAPVLVCFRVQKYASTPLILLQASSDCGHDFINEFVGWITLQVSHLRDERLMSKMGGKTIFFH